MPEEILAPPSIELPNFGLDILFEDEHIIAFNKPCWMLSVQGRLPDNQDSIAHRMELYCGVAHVVHRIDCATSGVLLFAKTKDAQREMNRQFRDRETDKEYVALGYGRHVLDKGEIKLPLLKDWPNRPKQKVDLIDGKRSTTQYEVLGRNGLEIRMRLIPITGRSHQLRLHMRALGIPIIGDRLYSPEDVASASGRMHLHALHLGFAHPIDQSPVSITAPCPF
ncbi:hypothetical protein A9Q99_18770 [Gammaproteobacteria bacterium 45_16_T64]|nr:hypothetical protein A9Q99_18770 [Gammaproteobacteria bacterium 45_16_T64]